MDSEAGVAGFEAAVTGRAALAGGVDARLPYQQAEVVLRNGTANARLRVETVSGDITLFKAAGQ